MSTMKTKYIRRLSLVISLLMIHGCCLYESDSYEQLTADDLRHLYFDRDKVVCEEEEIEFKDSVTFLLNSRDTISTAAMTGIWSSSINLGTTNNANGESYIYFGSTTGFVYAYIRLFRKYGASSSKKTFLVRKEYGGNDIKKVISEPFTLDTAIILGRLYESVYKFDFPRENGDLGIKSVYFAKKYGFIKIEGHDGSKLELIEVKSKGVKAHETKNPASTPIVGLEEKNKEVGN